jgi:hypothetical protein
VPSSDITIEDAITLVTVAKADVRKPEPTVLRGQWVATLDCDGGAPVVELARKVATYIIVGVRSTPATGRWTYIVRRLQTWAAESSEVVGESGTLKDAITSALAVALELAEPACSVRDVTRRASRDAAWAVTHPVKDPKARKDNIGDLGRPPKRKRKAAPERDASPGAQDDTSSARPTSTDAPKATAPSKRARKTGRKVAKPSRRRRAAVDAPHEVASTRASKRAVKGRKTGRKVKSERICAKCRMDAKRAAKPQASTLRRVPAQVVRHHDGSLRLTPTTAGSGGATWEVSNPEGLRVGQRVTMEFSPDETFARAIVETRKVPDIVVAHVGDTPRPPKSVEAKAPKGSARKADNPDQLLLAGFKDALADALREIA